MSPRSWWNARVIRSALPEALAYIGEPRGAPTETSVLATVLRSPALEAAAQDVFPREMSTPWSASVRQAFRRFLAARRRLTTQALPGFGSADHELSRARSLLLFRWEHNLCDGVGEAESHGFVTHANFPPWDLWLAIVVHDGLPCLVSFIPSWAAQHVDNAIAVTAYDDLAWGLIRSGRLENHGWGDIWGCTWDYERNEFVRDSGGAA